MSDLTDEDLVYLRTQLGTAADINDAQERYDRLGDTRLVVLEVLEQRLADLAVTPATFAVSGEYSQSTKENMDLLREQIGRLSAGAESASAYPVVTFVDPDLPLCR